jgi:hypothetical protein
MKAFAFLLRRELRAMAPVAVFFLAWWITAFAAEPSSLWPDWSGTNALALWWLGAFFGGRDERQGTAAFLDALPVSRPTRVVVQCIAAIMTLGIAVAIAFVLVWVRLHDRSSWDGADPAVVLAARACGGAFVMGAAMLAAGIATAPLGVVAVTFPVIFLLLQTLFKTELGPWRRLLPDEVVNLVEVGGHVRQSTPAFLFWLVFTIVCVELAVVFSRRPRRLTERARGGLVGFFVVVATVFTLIAVNHIRALPAPPVVVETRHYVFSLPAGTTVPEPAHLAQLDADAETLARWFGLTLDEPLRADATATLPGAHGKASGRLIALDVDTGLHRRVVAHETVHVLASMASSGAFNEPSALDTLSEGLAEYLTFRLLTPHLTINPKLKRLAPVVRNKELTDWHFVSAADAEALGGPAYPYFTGAAVVQAIADLSGEEAVFRMVRVAEGAVGTGHTGDVLRLELFGQAGLWWPAVLSRARALVNESIAAADASAPSTSKTSEERQLELDRRSPLPTVRVVDRKLVISAVRPDGSMFPATDEIHCSVVDSITFDVPPIESCNVSLSELAGTWANIQVSVGNQPSTSLVRVALPDHWPF